MILQNFKQTDLIKDGKVEDSLDMSLDVQSMTHLMSLLSSNLYQNPIEAIIQEYASNSSDSNTMAGNTNPIIISLQKDEINNYYIEFSDKGLGLSHQDFYDIMSKYGASSKRNSNVVLGMYGLGSKSAFAYSDAFTYDCVKDKKRNKFLFYKAETGFKIDLLLSEDTDKPNGVDVRIPIKDWYDVNKFKSGLKKKLCYFNNVYFNIYDNSIPNDYKIYQEKDFQWNTLYEKREMNLSIGKVNYDINWESLGITTIYVPITLKFEISDEIFPTPSRESITWTESTKTKVKNKIKDVANYFVQKYNKQIQEFPTLLKAWDFIDTNDKFVTLENKQFEISELEEYSDFKFNEPKVKGLEIVPIQRYKANPKNLLTQYIHLGRVRNNKYTEKWGMLEDVIQKQDMKTLLINDKFSGHFKKYCLEQGFETIVKPRIKDSLPDLEWYKKWVLINIPKKDWRKAIQEWQFFEMQISKELITNGTNWINSPEFEQFKKNQRVSYSYSKSSASNYQRINKQAGEITIQENISNYHLNGFKWEKKTKKINDLHKQPCLTLIFTENEKELCRKYYETFKNSLKIKYWVVGTQALKTILSLNLHNFKMYSQIKPQEVKDFRKLATAHLYSRLLTDYYKITENATDLIKETLEPLNHAVNQLKTYIRPFKNISNEFALEIIEECKSNKGFDLTLESEYLLVEKACKELNFLKYYSKPYGYSQREDFSKFINEQLLMRKLSEKYDLNSFQICVTSEVKEELLETA